MRILATTLFFVSTSVFACPDLTGHYPVCRLSTGEPSESYDMKVSQSVSNGITTYEVSSIDSETNETASDSIIADGKTRTDVMADPDMTVVLELAVTATCTANALKANVEVKYGGQTMASALTNISKVDNQLIITTSGHDGENEFSQTEICE